MTDQAIFSEITTWLATNYGSDRRDMWYVGIARDAVHRLFTEHQVDRNAGWIYRQALNQAHARSAETMLLNHGHDGGSGGGDHATVYVYAYRMLPGTVR